MPRVSNLSLCVIGRTTASISWKKQQKKMYFTCCIKCSWEEAFIGECQELKVCGRRWLNKGS